MTIIIRSTRFGRPMVARDGELLLCPDDVKPTEYPDEAAAEVAIEDAVAYAAGINPSSNWANPASYTTQPAKKLVRRQG